MKPGHRNKNSLPNLNSLRDRQGKFDHLLQQKEAEAVTRAAVRNEHCENERGIGDEDPDGTVYAGISPDTGKKMFALPANAPSTFTFDEAQKYADRTNAQKTSGHDDWRLPTKNELNVLFNNVAAIGGFNANSSGPAGWYRSASSDDDWSAWCQRFSDGVQVGNLKGGLSSVRLVRTEAPKVKGVRSSLQCASEK